MFENTKKDDLKVIQFTIIGGSENKQIFTFKKFLLKKYKQCMIIIDADCLYTH